MMEDPPHGWVMNYVEDEGLAGEIVVGDDNDWDQGVGEEWISKDDIDPE